MDSRSSEPICYLPWLDREFAVVIFLLTFRVYAHYPNGITHFSQECLPEGYSQERVARYQNDGALKSYHEITFSKGIIMNKVTIQGEGFKKDSPVLNNGIKVFNPVTECIYPFEDGIRSMVHHVSIYF